MAVRRIFHDKLVRDRIPDIIEQAGKRCAVDTLSEDRYFQALKTKLTEELREYEESGQPIELADMLEVIYALAGAMGLGRDALETMRRKKREERGGFKRRLFLRWVDE